MSQTFKSVEEIKERITWLNTLFLEIEEYREKKLLEGRWVKKMTDNLASQIIDIQQGIKFCFVEELHSSMNPWWFTGEFTAKDEDKQKARSFLDDWIKEGASYDKEYADKIRSQKNKNNITGGVIGGSVMSGKTTALILKANKEGLPIVVSTYHIVQDIKDFAKSMNTTAPEIITVQDLLRKKLPSAALVLVDEIEQVLESLIDCQIVTASTSLHMHEFESRANEGFKDNIKHRNFYDNDKKIAPCCKERLKNIE